MFHLQLLRMFLYILDVREFLSLKEEVASKNKSKNILLETLDTLKLLKRWVFKVEFLYSLLLPKMVL